MMAGALLAGPWSCMHPVTNSSRSMVPLRSVSNKMHRALVFYKASKMA